MNQGTESGLLWKKKVKKSRAGVPLTCPNIL
jgi:hypothetical protein